MTAIAKIQTYTSKSLEKVALYSFVLTSVTTALAILKGALTSVGITYDAILYVTATPNKATHISMGRKATNIRANTMIINKVIFGRLYPYSLKVNTTYPQHSLMI